MSKTVLSNKPGTSAVVHLNSSNTIVVAGNSSVSDIAYGNEVLTGAYIAQIFQGTGAQGHITLTRGGEIVGVYDSTGTFDYAGAGMALTLNQESDIVVDFVGTANAYVMIELQKVGTNLNANSTYFQV